MDPLPDDTHRITRRRAWLPTRMDDGAWRWGGVYVEVERLEPDESGWSDGVWRVVERW